MNRLAIGSLIIGFAAVLVLLVLSFSAGSVEPASKLLEVNWIAEDINSGGVIDYAQTTLLIKADGSASGSGGCNRFTTKATIAGSKITFKPAAATRMMCAAAVMDQEQKFLSALEHVRSYTVEADTGKLFLRDDAGSIIARLSRQK